MTLSEPVALVPSVERLAARAQAGDRAAFDALVVRLDGPLKGFLGRRLPAADVDDVAQEAFLRAFRALPGFDLTRRFETWLYAIAKHVAADHRDAERRRGAREERGAGPIAVAPAAEHDGGELWRRARRVLGDEAYRALWLRYAGDLSVGEIARALGKSAVATRVLLFRARKKLLEEDAS